MANISRDTYELNRLKHYVSVRLQQGVPLVDADWNEKDDIRRYELKSFIKWFIGDGVPQGNDGFRIESLTNKIVLTAKKEDNGESEIKIIPVEKNAAEILGFEEDNYQSTRYAPPGAQLTGNKLGPFIFAQDGLKLVVKVDKLEEETVTFNEGKFEAHDIVAHINDSVNNFTASTGFIPETKELDFDIKGGDGTPQGAGRCLVDGWEAINECNLTFKSQRLYENDDLAKLKAEDLQSENRTDLIYLDVWEREVDSEEDRELANNLIGIETCVRFKREWVVRIEPGDESEPDKPPALPDLPDPNVGNHVFYPLAHLRRYNNIPIEEGHITDLRRTGLALPSQNDFQQITTDAFGTDYTLDHDSQPNLEVSLRDAINSLLKGELPSTEASKITKDNSVQEVALDDNQGYIWLFWSSKGSEQIGNNHIWFKKYNKSIQKWEEDKQLTTAQADDVIPRVILDNENNIWVFWIRSTTSDGTNVYCNRYDNSTKNWWLQDKQISLTSNGEHLFPILDKDGNIGLIFTTTELTQTELYPNDVLNYHIYDQDGNLLSHRKLIREDKQISCPFAMVYNDDVYFFWSEKERGHFPTPPYDLKYVLYSNWSDIRPVSEDASDNIEPFAVVDVHHNIWVFWATEREGSYDIYHKIKGSVAPSWSQELPFITSNLADLRKPVVISDKGGNMWILWVSEINGKKNIWYKKKSITDVTWSIEKPLTTNPDYNNDNPFVVRDINGQIWIFWERWKIGPGSTIKQIWYKKFLSLI